MGIGNEADKLLEGPKDFMIDSFEFIKKNLERYMSQKQGRAKTKKLMRIPSTKISSILKKTINK